MLTGHTPLPSGPKVHADDLLGAQQRAMLLAS